MHESILEMTRLLAGAGAAEEKALKALCAAAEDEWRRRLRPGLAPEECEGAFLCAASLSALAGLSLLRQGGSGVSGFRAGDVSVSCGAGDASRAARALREQAERLMAPYTVMDDFAFRGVQA